MALTVKKDPVFAESALEGFFSTAEANWKTNLGNRGFIGAHFPNTRQVAAVAEKYSVLWWGASFKLVPTLEEAKAHRAKVAYYHEEKGSEMTEAIVQPIYILGSEAELGLNFEWDKKNQLAKRELDVPPETVKKLMARGGYEIFSDGRTEFVSPQQLQDRVVPTGMRYVYLLDMPASFGYNSLSQSGWVAMKEHGIHDYNEWKDTKAAKDVKKMAIKLFNRGYTVRFNHDYKACLDKIKYQVRSYRDKSSSERKNYGTEMSRYSRPEVYDTALARLEAGGGYSVELYDGSGQLVAGEIGFRVGNAFSGDSIFYDTIELGKVEALLLFEMLNAQGMPYSDPGMVTPYTKSMGGYNVPFDEFRRKIQSGPKERIQVPDLFDVRTEEDFRKSFDEIARRQNQAFTKNSYVTRLPVVPESALPIAAAAGVTQKLVEIVVVNNRAAAEAYAAKLTDVKELPIFLMPTETTGLPSSELAAADYLRASLAGERSAQIFYIKHPKHVSEVLAIDSAKFLEFLSLDVAGPRWVVPGEKITVPAWALKDKIGIKSEEK